MRGEKQERREDDKEEERQKIIQLTITCRKLTNAAYI